MSAVSSNLLEQLRLDADRQEALLRQVVHEQLAAESVPEVDDDVVATYYVSLRSITLSQLGKEIVYHSTSGIRRPPPNSLLAECTGKVLRIDAFDDSERIGLIHIGYPLKMLLQPDGHLTSCDILHVAAGAIVFDVYENQDARLVRIELPRSVLKTFPGPAYGAAGVRERTHFPATQPAFGTILKPTAGITPEEVGRLVEEAARCPLFLFVKEDENLYPHLAYSPVKERVRQAVAGIRRAQAESDGRRLIFAPHITGAPHEILETVESVLDAGAAAVMFSETFAGGAVRMVREATKHLAQPPAIYGHNAGIGTRSRHIWREIIDLFARLDGIDFRQTAPVKPGQPFLRPFGLEWEASEAALSQPIDGIRPTMIARAGGLDQGNICMNLADAERRGLQLAILFLAGSAINSIHDAQGKADPRIGAEAMQQAIEVHRSGALHDRPLADHPQALMQIAKERRWLSLQTALRQRYPELVA